jgi:hypothetical protein
MLFNLHGVLVAGGRRFKPSNTITPVVAVRRTRNDTLPERIWGGIIAWRKLVEQVNKLLRRRRRGDFTSPHNIDGANPFALEVLVRLVIRT